MHAMEEELNGNTWLAGERFSLADIAIAPFIERFEANNLDELIDFRKRTKIGSWWKKIKSRPSKKILDVVIISPEGPRKKVL